MLFVPRSVRLLNPIRWLVVCWSIIVSNHRRTTLLDSIDFEDDHTGKEDCPHRRAIPQCSSRSSTAYLKSIEFSRLVESSPFRVTSHRQQGKKRSNISRGLKASRLRKDEGDRMKMHTVYRSLREIDKGAFDLATNLHVINLYLKFTVLFR